MSERDLRRRHTGKGKAISRSRAPRPSSRRRSRPAGGIKWRRRSKSKVLTRSNSEPWLWKPGGDVVAAAEEDVVVGVLYRPRTCVDIFSTPESLVTRSPSNISQIADKIHKIITESGLKELGQLEQDIVFGDAGTKELINFLRVKEGISRENKLRLLMIYAAVYPEKFEDGKISKLMELAGLRPDDATAVHNMRLLESSSNPKKSSVVPFSLKFDVHKKKHAARKDRPGEEATWQLSRFYPIIEELVEKLSKSELPRNDYPCMNEPSPTIHGSSQTAAARPGNIPTPYSMRSRRTATWARPRSSDDGYSSDSILKTASSDFKRMGQRIFVFIVGGATRSELRVCHKLSAKLQREIVLGSSSIDDPPEFITKLKMLSTDELSLDDLQI